MPPSAPSSTRSISPRPRACSCRSSFTLQGTLLERHPRHRTAHASLISEILNLLAGQEPAPRASEATPLREPLTESETRILRYLPTNLPVQEIAGELYLSANTVKFHIRHHFAKLGAHQRSEAVERARALGLLAPSSRGR